MSENIVVNDSVKITVKFRDIDINGNEVSITVDTVDVLIKRSNGTTLFSTTQSISASFYDYVFTPTVADTYTVTFTGKYIVGSIEKIIVVEQKLYVSSVSVEYQPTITLGSDETITFASEITPLYLDPESILSYFPDASLLEIAEIINNYSLEIKNMYTLSDTEDGTGLSFTILEYIKAATACELSRTYGYGGNDEVTLSLGDFSVANRTQPRNSITRDNATTWCQIAAALRKEMLASRVGPKSMQPKGLPSLPNIGTSGKTYDPDTGVPIYLSDRDLYGPGKRASNASDPMPKRGFKRYD